MPEEDCIQSVDQHGPDQISPDYNCSRDICVTSYHITVVNCPVLSGFRKNLPILWGRQLLYKEEGITGEKRTATHCLVRTI